MPITERMSAIGHALRRLSLTPASPWARCVMTLIAAAAAAALPWVLAAPASVDAWPLIIATSLPWCVLWLAGMAVLRRPLTATALVWLIGLALHAINDIKLRQLGLPLMPADVYAATQLFATPLLYLRYLEPDPVLIALAALPAILFLLERPVLRAWRFRHVAVLLLAAGLLAGLPLRWQPWQGLYQQKHLNIMVWRSAEAARQAGLTAFFLHLQQYARPMIPVADPAALADFEKLPHHLPTEVTKAPLAGADVIVVQSESFFDPGRLTGIDRIDHIPHFHALSQRFSSGHLRVPTFGGLTTRTEFEFLTGYPLAGAEDFQYPYQALLNRRVHALPWSFRRAGYIARAVHPYDRRFYNRDVVYPQFGFESFHSSSEYTAADRHGYYVSDAAMTERLIELADAAHDETPIFLFAVSMENHGPWNEGRGIDDAGLPPLPEDHPLHPDDAPVMQRFLHHLQRTDAALDQLTQWALQRERPTVVLFYGDHLPQLEGVLAHWPFVDGESPGKQPLPWLLLANRPFEDVSTDLDSAQLGALLARLLGLEDPLFEQLERLRHALPPEQRTERLRLHASLAAQRLTDPTEDFEDPSWDDGLIAELLDWWPQGTEANSARDGRLTIRLQFAEPPPRDALLTLGDRGMRIHRDGSRWNGELESALTYGLRSNPVTAPLVLHDPMTRQQQILGEFVVRPRASRLPTADGRGERPFCAIEYWGPDQTSLTAPANPQPDGGLGLWVQADCLPPQTRIVVAGEALDTLVNDRKATAVLPPGRLQAGHRYPMQLHAEGDVLDLGELQVTD